MFQKSLHFKGKSQFDNKDYEMEIKLLKDVVPERTKYQIRPRFIEIVLEKISRNGRMRMIQRMRLVLID